MPRQITTGYGAPQTAFLEQRITALESSVAALAAAVRALVGGLEGTPAHRPDLEETARSAHLAHELLLEAGLGPRPHR